MIDRTNRNTALATALVDELGRSGCRRAFLSPGSRSTPIALALDAAESIELTVVLDERAAAFAALGASIAGGDPALLACTSGSAAANYLPAVVEADQAGVPLLVLTSDRPPELRGIGAGQTIDQIGLYGSAVRWFCEAGIHDADDAGLLHMRSIGCRAVGEARSGRGPVHLNLSWREPLGPEPIPTDVTATDRLVLEGRTEGRPLTVAIASREPRDELIDALVGALRSARRPAIVAGRLPDRTLTTPIAELAAALGAPILAEPTSQLRFGPHDRSALVTTYDLIARSRPEALRPDLVVRFGDMPTSKALRAWLGEEAIDQIVIDPPGRWNEPTRRAGALVRAGAASVAARLAESLEGSADREYRATWAAAERVAVDALEPVLEAGPELSEPLVQRALGDAYADGERVLLASSMPVRDAEAFLGSGEAALTFHANRGANGIDGLIATASGLATAGDPVWVVLGDLALAHDLGGLALVADAPGPVRVVVVDNGGGGIFDFLPQATQIERQRFERLFTTPSGLDVERAAALFDLDYALVRSRDDLAGLAGSGRVVAHVPVARAGNKDLHDEVTGAVASAVAGLSPGPA